MSDALVRMLKSEAERKFATPERTWKRDRDELTRASQRLADAGVRDPSPAAVLAEVGRVDRDAWQRIDQLGGVQRAAEILGRR